MTMTGKLALPAGKDQPATIVALDGTSTVSYDERVLATECGREVFDERVEETLACFRLYALDDLAQRCVAGRAFCRETVLLHQGELQPYRHGVFCLIDSSADAAVRQQG